MTRLGTLTLLLLVLLGASGTTATAEQAGSATRGFQAGTIAAGDIHTCALTTTRAVRCWGLGSFGRLGYGNTANIGDTEPASAGGDVALGGPAEALAVGFNHSCAALTSGAVRCWGQAVGGQLGIPGGGNVGDDETPASVAAVDVGGPVAAVAAGTGFTCALLRAGSVRCWGSGTNGRLGYGNTATIGDTETPASAGDVPLGGTATAITAGGAHACALLTGGAVRCWGTGNAGRLGYGNANDIGDTETPASAGDVPLGGTATAVSAGNAHTCALLNTGAIRCWGLGTQGRLGYGNTAPIGDDEPASTPGDVPLGGTAVAVSAGDQHTCAVMTTGAIRCWGDGGSGQLGRGAADDIGDTEAASAGGEISVGGPASAVTTGAFHTCALLRTGGARCFGDGAGGALGYGNTTAIGNDELPSSVAEVPVGASLPGLVADLSLALAAPGSATTGQAFAVTVTVANTGPDAAPGVTVAAVPAAGTAVDAVTPSQGTYDPGIGSWQVGALAADATATLTFALRRTTAGRSGLAAELLAAGAFDRDSTPGNSVDGEDDRASVLTTVDDLPVAPTPGPTPAPTPVATPPVPAGTSPSRVKGRLALTAKPRRGRRTLAVTGTLTLPVGSVAAACSGRVRLTVRDAARKSLGTKTVALTRPASGRTCRLTGTVTLKRALRARQKLTLAGSVFAGPTLSAVSTTKRLSVPRR